MEVHTLAQARTEKKRAQIRTAAKALFLRSGFQGTSTDAIAAAAGVSKETLYRYYGTHVFSTLLSYGVLDGLLLNAQTPQMPEAGVIDTFVEHIMEVISAKNNG